MKILLLTAFFACNESKDSAEPANEPEASEPEASEPETTEPSNEPTGDASNGASLVESKCMGCHSGNPAIDARGTPYLP